MVHRKWSQYSLKSLMAAVVVLGLAFVRLEKYLSEQRPIAWQPFSRALLEEKRAAGSPVLVIFDVKGTVEPALETQRVRRLLRSTGIVPMRADARALYYRGFSDKLHQDLISLGVNPTPEIAVFPVGDNAKPVKIGNWDLSEGEAIAAIHRAVRPGSSAPGPAR